MTIPVADVQVSKTADRTTTVRDDTVTYTVTVTNSGQAALTGATLTDDLTDVLDDATFVSASASTGTATFTPPTLTWTGDLPVGDTATVTYSVLVTGLGDRTLVNLVVAPLPGSNCAAVGGDPVQCADDHPGGRAQDHQGGGAAATVAGGTVTYTVTVTNTGQTTQSGLLFTDDLTGVLDDAAFGTVTATVGTASFAAAQLDYAATLAPGAVGIVTYTAEVGSPALGDLHLINVLASITPGATCTAAEPCTTDTPVGRFTIAKAVDRAEAVPGQPVTYTVTLTNTGQTALAGATFTDDLAAVLDDATFDTATANAGSAVFTPPNLVWTGDLAIGASATVTYTVTVRDPDPGDHLLTNVLVSSTPGSTCPADQPCGTDTPVSGLDIVKQVDRTTAAPGDLVTYTVTATNAGQTALGRRDVHRRPRRRPGRRHPGDGLRLVGSGRVRDLKVTWTGNLAVGASVDGHLHRHRQPAGHRRPCAHQRCHVHHGGGGLSGVGAVHHDHTGQ